MRVLYVEDENMTRMIMTRHLTAFFGEVVTATNGEEGLNLYQQKDYHLVISDIMMPLMDGLEMIQAIKAINQDQRIVLISAQDDADLLLKAIELEVSSYLIKPVFREKLIQVLYNLVKIINQQQRIQEAEKALQESERRYRTLVDNLPIGIYRKESGPFGSLIMINPALTKMLDYREEELLGLSFQDLLYGEDTHSLASEEFFQEEVCLRKRGGDPLNVVISSQKVKDTSFNVSFYDGTIEDITQRKEAENRLALYMAEIEKKNLALEEANDKIHEDLNKARLIHQQLLPSQFPQVEGVSFAVHYQPAMNIGGDFYNMHLVEEQLLFYLTDVTGHGLDGAILSVFVRETVNSYMNSHQEICPSTLLEYIANHYCQEKFPYDYYICMLIGLYHLEEGLLSLVNAGIQVGPYLATYDHLLNLSFGGPPISGVYGTELLNLTPKSLYLKGGDTLLLTTDGLIEENCRGEMYGEERLKDILFKKRNSSPQQIIDAINMSFEDYCGDLQGKDDITLLILQKDNQIPP